MRVRKAVQWVKERDRRKVTVLAMHQPITPMQFARKTNWTLDACCYALWELSSVGVARCLNHGAQRCRVYWLTDLGMACQHRMRRMLDLKPRVYTFPQIDDWELYGSLCFRHREAVMKALTEPMKPASVKRRALQRDGQLRMSANNAREVIRHLRHKELVQRIGYHGERWPRYELTARGHDYRRMLVGADFLDVDRALREGARLDSYSRQFTDRRAA